MVILCLEFIQFEDTLISDNNTFPNEIFINKPAQNEVYPIITLYREKTEEKYTMARAKEHINLVFIGHVDHGKSTTVGRLLYDTGNIEEQAMPKKSEKHTS